LQDSDALNSIKHSLDRIEALVSDLAKNGLNREIQHRWIIEAADYIHTNLVDAVEFLNKPYMYSEALKGVSVVDGIFAEFGVFNGESINIIARLAPNSIIFGFDSFEGLREDWRGQTAVKGSFSLQGRTPPVEKNVRLVKGWFHETLPQFLHLIPKKPFSFIHVDCDTYEATKTILDCAGSRIVRGTIIIFDEYFGYRGWKNGEFKAWKDFVSEHNLVYRYRGFHAEQVVIEVVNRPGF